MDNINFDDYTTDQIYQMIEWDVVTNDDVVHFYNNIQWDDEV